MVGVGSGAGVSVNVACIDGVVVGVLVTVGVFARPGVPVAVAEG